MSNSTYPKKSDFDRMSSLYGENNVITGNYSDDTAAVCENGVFVGKEQDGVLIFKGIPFAKPPVGRLRWKAPEPADASDIVREAYYFGKSPIQAPWYSELASCYPQSEDCLYLNVWASEDRSEKKPVMVFIHGGAYGYGGTADPIYDGFNFVRAHPDVILVTIAYRVGIMGFIDFSMLPDSEGYEDSVNLGILDQIEALRWISRNISAFGGDPDCVTLFGESAGGGSVSILPVIDKAKGLFRRVIAESGSICLTYSREECAPFTKKLLKSAGVTTLAELLEMSTDELYQANLPINEDNNFPVRDGRLIPFDLYQAYADGKSAWVDMISGTNKDECRYWISEMGGAQIYALGIPVLFENQCRAFDPEDVREARRYFKKGNGKLSWRLTEFENDIAFRVPAQEQLCLHAQNGGRSYHYFWTYPSALKNRGACHAVELSSVFNNLQEDIYTGSNVNPELAAEVQQMWVNFAKTGDPSTEEHTWPRYYRYSKQTMVLGNEIYIKENLLSRRTEIIEKLLKYKISGNYAMLNYNIPYIRFLAVGAAVVTAALIFGTVKLIKKH